MRPKIVVINGLLVRHDAISASVAEMMRAFNARWAGSAHFFGYACEEPDIPHTVVSGVGEILSHPKFIEADVVVFHFGIYYELFDAIILCAGMKPTSVVYHNITPRELLSPAHHPIIDRSFKQLELISFADEVWGDSPFNLRDVHALGHTRAVGSVIGLPIQRLPHEQWLSGKPGGQLELLFIGRFVPSKGVSDLISALSIAKANGCPKLRLSLVGGIHFSDQKYLEHVKDMIRREGLSEWVDFVGGVNDHEKRGYLQRTHLFVMPSYHEGYCAPIIEAFSAGCAVLAYASAAIPETANGLAELCKTGDIIDMAERLQNFSNRWTASSGNFDKMRVAMAGGEMSGADFRLAARRYAIECGVEAFAGRSCLLLEQLLTKSTAVQS